MAVKCHLFKVWFEKLHATTKFLFEAADKYELKLPLWLVSDDQNDLKWPLRSFPESYENLKKWFVADKNQAIWRKDERNGRIGSEKTSQRKIEKSYHASRRSGVRGPGFRVMSSRLVPIDQCRRTTVRRHGPWIPETEIDGMSKLRGKLQIVISKIKYYWIIVSEIILRRLKQGKVLSVLHQNNAWNSLSDWSMGHPINKHALQNELFKREILDQSY